MVMGRNIKLARTTRLKNSRRNFVSTLDEEAPITFRIPISLPLREVLKDDNPVNPSSEKNAAIVEKYGAYTSSLFINTVRNGSDHIEPVTDIWYALGDDEAFIEVVKSKIETSLKEVG